MKQITTAEFKNNVELDPAWASTLTETMAIVGLCEMKGSNIGHLSSFLHSQLLADFSNCQHLKVAKGKFDGSFSFKNSGI